MAPGALPLVVCTRCGSTAESLLKGSGLNGACKGGYSTSARAKLNKLAAEGRHPHEERGQRELRYQKVDIHQVPDVDQVILDFVEPIERKLYRLRR